MVDVAHTHRQKRYAILTGVQLVFQIYMLALNNLPSALRTERTHEAPLAL